MFEMGLRVVALPRQIEERCDLVVVAEESSVAAAHLAFLTWVHLVEVSLARACFADPDRNREHRLRHVQHRGGCARTLRHKHEAGEIGSRLRCGGDVLLARQAAHLHERAGEKLGEPRGRVWSRHQRRADEDRVSAGKLGGRALGPGMDPRFGNNDAAACHAGDELELSLAIDAKRRQIACIDPDYGSVERDRTVELLRVVRLDECVEPERRREPHQLRAGRVVEVAQ